MTFSLSVYYISTNNHSFLQFINWKLMTEPQIQQTPKIYNIKGLSWMLKSSSGTSSPCSTTSSHIDQQFKVFKLKDEKKKWKKKINKKFQSVGQQIENVIKHKYSLKQPFDITFKKQEDLKHMPHLKHGKTFVPSTRQSLFQQSRISQTSNQMFRISQKLPSKTASQNENTFNYKKDSVSQPIDQYEFEKNVIGLRKVFGEIKNENSKVKQSKNIMRIHSQQKEYLEKHNQEFFRRQHQWIDDKVEFYNEFDIKDYENDLIQKMCKGQSS